MIMWKNMVQPAGAQMTTQYGAKNAIVCRIIKARIHTFILFNTYCFSTATMVTRTHRNVKLYVQVHCCLVNYRNSVGFAVSK
jgi:hypothetical protein